MAARHFALARQETATPLPAPVDLDDAALIAKAMDRWYVPDPNKEADLEKIRAIGDLAQAALPK